MQIDVQLKQFLHTLTSDNAYLIEKKPGSNKKKLSIETIEWIVKSFK